MNSCFYELHMYYTPMRYFQVKIYISLSLEGAFFSNSLAIFVLKYFYKTFPDSYNSDTIFPQRALQLYVVKV